MLRVAEGLQASNNRSHETQVAAPELKHMPTGHAAQLVLYDTLFLSSCLVLWPLEAHDTLTTVDKPFLAMSKQQQ